MSEKLNSNFEFDKNVSIIELAWRLKYLSNTLQEVEMDMEVTCKKIEEKGYTPEDALDMLNREKFEF